MGQSEWVNLFVLWHRVVHSACSTMEMEGREREGGHHFLTAPLIRHVSYCAEWTVHCYYLHTFKLSNVPTLCHTFGINLPH